MAKTYLSSDFKLNGNIKSQGDIEIDGQIKGKVVGNSVSVFLISKCRCGPKEVPVLPEKPSISFLLILSSSFLKNFLIS